MKNRISLRIHLIYHHFLFPKLRTNMKIAFYDDISAMQAAVIEVLKKIPINHIKKHMHALVDHGNFSDHFSS